MVLNTGPLVWKSSALTTRPLLAATIGTIKKGSSTENVLKCFSSFGTAQKRTTICRRLSTVFIVGIKQLFSHGGIPLHTSTEPSTQSPNTCLK